VSIDVKHAGLTDRGQVREQNQDRWLAEPEVGLYVVSDGMGGEVAGERASRIVVEILPAIVREQLDDGGQTSASELRDRLGQSLVELNENLKDQTEQNPSLEGMGATVVAALKTDSECVLAHLGDSRAYLLRCGELRQITRDHSLVQLLMEEGELTPEEAERHPARSQLRRFVGMPGEALPETHRVKLQAGDCLLLCTDGLTDMLDDGDILAICQDQPLPEAACRALVAAANEAGGLDNITVLIVSVPQETD
jgi:protein phosphatase